MAADFGNLVLNNHCLDDWKQQATQGGCRKARTEALHHQWDRVLENHARDGLVLGKPVKQVVTSGHSNFRDLHTQMYQHYLKINMDNDPNVNIAKYLIIRK